MQCYTLKNSILILYFWLFIITNFGGAKYSLDNYLIRKNYKLSKLLIKCYNISGNLSLKNLKQPTYLFSLLTQYYLLETAYSIYRTPPGLTELPLLNCSQAHICVSFITSSEIFIYSSLCFLFILVSFLCLANFYFKL